MMGVDDNWTETVSRREQTLLNFILAQESLRAALNEGPVVELRATSDDLGNSLVPTAAIVEFNTGNSAEAQATLRRLKSGLRVILVYNLLQFLTETRRFLGLCFSKLSVGGMLIVTVPHQFLYERKLRLPSRRNRLHRRFYTPNTLFADIEEAIDPCEYRVRFVGENDADYDYVADLKTSPDGGQDIIVALERIARPLWRPELDNDELWVQRAEKPLRYLELNKDEPAPIRMIAPDKEGVNSILLLKLDHRGDFLMATEAFKLFRDGFPEARITLVCGSWNVGEAEKSGLFDEVVPFDLFPEDDSARVEAAPREILLKKFARAFKGKTYDLAVDLRLYDDSREALQSVRARNRAGFDRYDLFPWLSIRLDTPSATVDDRAETGVITAEKFFTSVGKHKTYEIRYDASFSAESKRDIVWGPYGELKPGRYQFECLIEPLADDFEIAFDIVTDSGTRTIVAGVLQIARDRHPALDFQLNERLQSFEFRLVASPAFEVKPFRFLGLRFVRPSVIRGVHQSEAMALLAHLVRLRMHDAYAAELL